MTSESSWNHGLRWKSLARQDAVQPTVTKAPKGVGSALGCHVMSLLVISHLHLLSAHIMFISCYPNLLELDPFFAVFCTIFSNFCAWGFEAHSEGDASAAWTHWRTSAGSRGAESDCPGMVPMVKGDDFLCCTVPLLWSRRFWARDFLSIKYIQILCTLVTAPWKPLTLQTPLKILKVGVVLFWFFINLGTKPP